MSLGVGMSSEQRGRGRPSEYRPEYCDKVIEMGKQGCSVVEMAAAIGVARMTLETRWPAEHEDFREALQLARDASQAWWEAQGRVNLIMPKDAGTFQASVWSRSMAARFPRDWRENKGVELTGANGGPVQTLQVEFVRATSKPGDDGGAVS